MSELETGWNFSPKNLLVFGLCVWVGSVLCLLLGVFMRNICTWDTPVQVRIDPITITPEIRISPVVKQEPPVVNVQTTAPVVNVPQGPAPVVNVRVERDQQPEPKADPKPEQKPKAEKAAAPAQAVATATPPAKPAVNPEEEKARDEWGKAIPPPAR